MWGLRYRKLGMLIEHLETRTWEMQALMVGGLWKVWILGSLKETHFGGIKQMQMYGSFEGFALQNVLFGSVK